MPREAGTQPGEWPGIYACDHTKLLSIYGDTLRAGLAALKGDLAAAEVTVDPRSEFNMQSSNLFNMQFCILSNMQFSILFNMQFSIQLYHRKLLASYGDALRAGLVPLKGDLAGAEVSSLLASSATCSNHARIANCWRCTATRACGAGCAEARLGNGGGQLGSSHLQSLGSSAATPVPSMARASWSPSKATHGVRGWPSWQRRFLDTAKAGAEDELGSQESAVAVTTAVTCMPGSS